MRKVIGIGETVLDIIFKDDEPVSAVPGGSVFNALISLGRAGVNAALISETGNDHIGKKIIRFMESNGIDSSNVNVYAESKSPLSLAFLNEKNDAEYIFYKDHPHDQLDFIYPDIQPDDIVMFGSFYAINPVIRPQVAGLLEYAKNHGAILYYDVNFRASHSNEVMKITPNLLDNLEMADVVRGSNEDFSILFKHHDADSVYRTDISFYCHNFIYTQGSEPVEVRAEGGINCQYPVGNTQTVSTIGAGDNFNAGFVYGLIKYGITKDDIQRGLTREQWDKLVECAQMFSCECCKSLNNYISKEFGKKLKIEGGRLKN
ncbi:MAG: PfkB family carbohydrate kinase [Prevotella sp.]|nr:PfkB family carbohydrate kinase [Prevotella sp.]